MTDQPTDRVTTDTRCTFANDLGRCVLTAGHYPDTAHRYEPHPKTDQPTDYRTEAVLFLARAFDETVDIESPTAVASLLWDIRQALIGIGHALLAQPPAVRMRIRDGQWETMPDPGRGLVCQICGGTQPHTHNDSPFSRTREGAT